VAAGRSTDPRPAAAPGAEPGADPVRRLVRDIRGLRGEERIAMTGVGIILISLLLPWYGVPLSGDLVRTGLGAFSFAEAGLVLTCLATAVLALRIGGGYVPPRPLKEWGLLVAAGAWSAAIIVYRMIDRPRFEFLVFDEPHGLRYGIFVALAGAGVIVAAGIRARRRDRAAREGS